MQHYILLNLYWSTMLFNWDHEFDMRLCLLEYAVCLSGCSFTWNDNVDNTPTLSDIDINIKHGSLVAVVGVVGSGESSLVSALLGDMLKVKGKASVSVSWPVCLFLRPQLVEHTDIAISLSFCHW